jgi:phage regulator Rha-like protein
MSILTVEQIEVSLKVQKGELRIDSRIVAGGIGLKSHKDYRYQILEKYESEFAQLGSVLKTTLEDGTIVWYLSEAQMNFAGTLARNTTKAVAFKLALVKAFELAKTKKSDSEYPKQITGDIAANPTAELIGRIHTVFDLFFPNLTPELLLGMKIEAACSADPTLRPMLEPHKPKLLLDAPLLSPKAIGEILEERSGGVVHSSQKVNKMLIEKGLQVATGDKKLAYKATGQGIEFSKVVADTAAGHGKTIQSLRWYKSVCNLLTA